MALIKVVILCLEWPSLCVHFFNLWRAISDNTMLVFSAFELLSNTRYQVARTPKVHKKRSNCALVMRRSRLPIIRDCAAFELSRSCGWRNGGLENGVENVL